MANEYDGAVDLNVVRKKDGSIAWVAVRNGITTTYARISPRGTVTVLEEPEVENSYPLPMGFE